MTDQKLITYIASKDPGPTFAELRSILNIRSTAAVRERCWPLLEQGLLDLDPDTARLTLVRGISRNGRHGIGEYAPHRKGRRATGPYDVGTRWRVDFYSADGKKT